MVGILSLLCVCFCLFVFVCFFVCTVTDFSAAEKDSSVELGTIVHLLSGQVFAHFGELWPAWSHGSGVTSGMYGSTNWCQAAAPGEARWAVGIACRGLVGQLELGAAASRKAVWWDLRLVSLLTQLCF